MSQSLATANKLLHQKLDSAITVGNLVKLDTAANTWIRATLGDFDGIVTHVNIPGTLAANQGTVVVNGVAEFTTAPGTQGQALYQDATSPWLTTTTNTGVYVGKKYITNPGNGVYINGVLLKEPAQRMVTRQSLTPTAIVTANPLVPDTVNWFGFGRDLYVSSVSYTTTTPSDGNSLVDFDGRANLRISLPNHSAEVNSRANVGGNIYDGETSDNYSADKNNVWSVSQVQTKTSAVAAGTALSITHQSRIRIDTGIAPVTNGGSIIFANFVPIVTFIPTY